MGQPREPFASSLIFPQRLGRYDILAPIASGGMGAVYLARTHGVGGFERELALKILHPHIDQQDTVARELIEEAKLVARIHHPNVVQVYDLDEERGCVFMTMEYVEGCTLNTILNAASSNGRFFPPELALRILIDALGGLHAAHELKGPDNRPLALVHRDFSPHNILIGIDGISKLADFGIAKAIGRDSRTATGTVKGKLAYMAPEQVRGLPIDRRCDIWAAGVVAWEAFANRRLFVAPEEAAIMYQILEGTLPRLRSAGTWISEELDEVVMRALMKVPAGRYPTAAVFARALQSVGFEPAFPEEVAEYVQGLVGKQLAERRAQFAEITGPRPATSPNLLATQDQPSVALRTAPTGDTHNASAVATQNPTPVQSTNSRSIILAAALGMTATSLLALALWPRASVDTTATAADAKPEASAVASTVEPIAQVPSQQPSTSPVTSSAPTSSASARSTAPNSTPVHTAKAKPTKRPLPLADSPYKKKL